MNYRIVILASGERDYAGNGMRYETAELALIAARELASRWFAVKAYTVILADLTPDRGSYWSPELIASNAVFPVSTF